jgi:protein arginine N-methyltransferase 3
VIALHDMSDFSSDDDASSVGSIVEDASEPDTTSFKDLFSDRQWTRVSDMVEHNKTENGFDLIATIRGLGPGMVSNASMCSAHFTSLG